MPSERIEAFLAEAEDAQCDAVCKPAIHVTEDGEAVCTGCGAAVTLVLAALKGEG